MTTPSPGAAPRARFLNRDGTSNVARIGTERGIDPYHALLTATWPRFFAVVIAFYVVFNCVFAALYLVEPQSITNARAGSYEDAFFFSIQTMMTIGYGVMAPATRWAHALVAIESLVGLLTFAVVTGIMFARFSRPRARIIFSNSAIVGQRDGKPALFFRMANGRRSHIVEAELHVSLARTEVTAEGEQMRRVYDLRLARERNSTFALSWTVIHPIDEASPLFGVDREKLVAQNVEIIVSVMGLDDTTLQTVHARSSYGAADVLWGGRFADIFVDHPDGRRTVDLARIHDVLPG